jgi:hypothetical protein
VYTAFEQITCNKLIAVVFFQECGNKNLNMIGHTHDGDGRLRKVWRRLILHGSLPESTKTAMSISSPIVQAVAPEVRKHSLPIQSLIPKTVA